MLASVAVSLVLLGGHVLPFRAMAAPGGDPGLMTWNLWVVDDAVRQGRNPFFTDAVYYPLGATLAKHTLVPGFWPITFLVRLATRGDVLAPVYAYRVCILLSFALGLGASYLLLRRLGLPRIAALAPSLLYAFSPFDRLHIPHLNHVSAAFLLPLLGLALLRLLRAPRPGNAALAGFVLGVGVYFSELTAFVYLGVPIGLVVALLLPSTRQETVSFLRGLGGRGFLAGALAFCLTLAPFAASWGSDTGKAPKTRQAANWSANAAGFLVPDPVQTPLYRGLFGLAGRITKGIGGHETFLGFPLVAFAAVAMWRLRGGPFGVLGILAIVYLVLSLGPLLKVGPLATTWPLPYAALMKVPPFEMGRTPVRCVLMALFCLTPLAGSGLAAATDGVRRRFGGLAGSVAGLAVLAWAVAEVYVPGPLGRPYVPPAELHRLVPGPVMNVPISVFDGYAVFLQTLHGQPVGTGFVSRRTPAQVAHVRALDLLLETDPGTFVARLREMGFTNLILGPGTPAMVAEQLRDAPINVVDLRREAAGWSTPADLDPGPGER